MTVIRDVKSEHLITITINLNSISSSKQEKHNNPDSLTLTSRVYLASYHSKKHKPGLAITTKTITSHNHLRIKKKNLRLPSLLGECHNLGNE
jgi:hypothetical protein